MAAGKLFITRYTKGKTVTKEIKKQLKHLLEIAERMITREQPHLAEAIKVIRYWIEGIDYRSVRKMNNEERDEHESGKLRELSTKIGSIGMGQLSSNNAKKGEKKWN
jgi:hypothetical protein